MDVGNECGCGPISMDAGPRARTWRKASRSSRGELHASPRVRTRLTSTDTGQRVWTWIHEHGCGITSTNVGYLDTKHPRRKATAPSLGLCVIPPKGVCDAVFGKVRGVLDEAARRSSRIDHGAAPGKGTGAPLRQKIGCCVEVRQLAEQAHPPR